MERGCEVEFLYDEKVYSITQRQNRIIICEAYHEATEKEYDHPAAALDYKIGDKKLKEILFDMKIIFRSI